MPKNVPCAVTFLVLFIQQKHSLFARFFSQDKLFERSLFSHLQKRVLYGYCSLVGHIIQRELLAYILQCRRVYGKQCKWYHFVLHFRLLGVAPNPLKRYNKQSVRLLFFVSFRSFSFRKRTSLRPYFLSEKGTHFCVKRYHFLAQKKSDKTHWFSL